MSYCRWSSNNFKCDLYCYEDATGYAIHVAANRWGDGWPKPVPKACFKDGVYQYGVDPEADRLFEEHWEEEGKHIHPIELPFAGMTFHVDTLEDMRDKIKELVAIGYKVPDYVFTRIDEEIKERDNGQA